jgi:putative ABC transport system permease protein
MIPIKYNLRNLRVRWVTTLSTALSIGLIVWASCLVFGLAEGLRQTLIASGDPLDLIVLRQGSTNETNSGFELRKYQEMGTLDGIACDASGHPLIAGELVNVPVVERRDGSRSNIIIRGVSAASPGLRPGFAVIRGRYFDLGQSECIVGRGIAGRFKGAVPGGVLAIGGTAKYRVVGIFAAGGGAAESEVWADFNALGQNTGREGLVSSVQLRASSSASLERLRETIARQPRFRLEAMREPDYYAGQGATIRFLKAVGILIALLLTVGAMFASANTMYAAVRARTREIGTMRAIGYTRTEVLTSFLAESILLCVAGSVLGLLATLPMGGLRFGVSNFGTYTESVIPFRFGPPVMAVATIMTTAIGVFGGLLPALRAVRLDVSRALREP